MNYLKNQTDKMKKNYIQPEITASLRYEVEKPLCISTRSVQIGNYQTTEYSNGKWFNEGYNNSSADASITIAGDDNGILSSSTKSRGGDWGSIW